MKIFLLNGILNQAQDGTGCSAVGSALGSGPRGRMFKSCHSDQQTKMHRFFCAFLFVLCGI